MNKILLAVTLVLVGVVTASAQTNTPTPANTATRTPTSTPSVTRTPSYTKTPVQTATRTLTPLPTGPAGEASRIDILKLPNFADLPPAAIVRDGCAIFVLDGVLTTRCFGTPTPTPE